MQALSIEHVLNNDPGQDLGTGPCHNCKQALHMHAMRHSGMAQMGHQVTVKRNVTLHAD